MSRRAIGLIAVAMIVASCGVEGAITPTPGPLRWQARNGPLELVVSVRPREPQAGQRVRIDLAATFHGTDRTKPCQIKPGDPSCPDPFSFFISIDEIGGEGRTPQCVGHLTPPPKTSRTPPPSRSVQYRRTFVHRYEKPGSYQIDIKFSVACVNIPPVAIRERFSVA